MKPLQIDEDVFREWILLYFDRMRDMETEVLVYRGAIEILLTEVPSETRGAIERLVVGIRNRPEVTQHLDEKYQKYREQALEAVAKGSHDQALSRYLQEWKAKGPIN